MAKTFDVSDPDQYEAYLAESTAQMALYGDVHMEYGLGWNITIHDARDVTLEYGYQPGFKLVMDDGSEHRIAHPEARVVIR